jgi:hypothetical protein
MWIRIRNTVLIFYVLTTNSLKEANAQTLKYKRQKLILLSTYGLYRILSSYWLAHFCLMKKYAVVLHKPSSESFSETRTVF